MPRLVYTDEMASIRERLLSDEQSRIRVGDRVEYKDRAFVVRNVYEPDDEHPTPRVQIMEELPRARCHTVATRLITPIGDDD